MANRAGVEITVHDPAWMAQWEAAMAEEAKRTEKQTLQQMYQQAQIDDRRLRSYAISKSGLMGLLRGTHRVELGDMPADARITNVIPDYFAQGVVIFIHSMQFDSLLDGSIVPPAGWLKVVPIESPRRGPEFL